MRKFKQWYVDHRLQIQEDYFRFLRFASISADPAYAQQVLQCARFLTQYLQIGGFHAEELSTPGFPIVYAEDLRAGSSKPTLLIYGHYDVQPVDPIELWASPPFEPTIRDGKIFARGAVDDKGQIFYACLAALSFKKMNLPLPVNLKFCIEGEEESHSLGLSKALPSIAKKLAADHLLIVDFDALSDGTPAITLGARGCIALEVTLIGSNSDLHSGILGGVAYNPNRALAELLSKLWDENGSVTVPGFYDGVRDLHLEEIQRYQYSTTKESLKKDFGITCIGGEKNRSLQEANWFRPTLEINGMFGGYIGSGIKTVIPMRASAKISCRLVPGQNPDQICRAIGDFLQKNVAYGMKVEVELHGGVGAFRGHPQGLLAKALIKAAEEVTEKRCQSILSGASIPIAAQMAQVLNAQIVGMGYGLATDNIHAPNEHFDMERFEKGFLTVARMIEML